MAKGLWYVGDSLVWGWTSGQEWVKVATPPVTTFAGDLPGGAYDVTEKGQPGARAWQVIDGFAGENPWETRMAGAAGIDFVILGYGMNEADKGDSLASYKDALRSLANTARAYAKFVIFETPNPSTYISTVAQFAQAMREVGAEMNIPVIDQFSMIEEYRMDNGLTLESMVPDGMHPTQSTYTLKGHYAATRFLEITAPDSDEGGEIMSHIIEDRICETITATGSGPFAVNGAVLGCKPFNSVCSVGDTFYGTIEAIDANGQPNGKWVTATMTYSAANQISVTTVHRSSEAADAMPNFDVGTKRVFLDLIAYQVKLIAAGTPAPSPTPTPTPSPGSMPFGINAALIDALIFDENFDGTALNFNLWGDQVWFEENWTTKNYQVSGGRLRFYPQKDAVTGRFQNRVIETDGKWYTPNNRGWGYYYEMKAKLCRGYGTWPSFWLFNRDGTQRLEVDIMEAYPGAAIAGFDGWASADARPLAYAGNIWPTPDFNLGERGSNSINPFGSVDLSAGDHYYGCLFESTGITFYFDGVALGATGAKKVNFDATQYFNDRMYIILGLWYGSASGDPNASGAPQPAQGVGNSYEIDHVRVWSLKNP